MDSPAGFQTSYGFEKVEHRGTLAIKASKPTINPSCYVGAGFNQATKPKQLLQEALGIFILEFSFWIFVLGPKAPGDVLDGRWSLVLNIEWY